MRTTKQKLLMLGYRIYCAYSSITVARMNVKALRREGVNAFMRYTEGNHIIFYSDPSQQAYTRK